MKQTFSPLDKYSVIEITIGGQGLRAPEKDAARNLLLRSRISERNFVVSDFRGTFRISCYTYSEKKVLEIRDRFLAWRYQACASRVCPLCLKVKKLRRNDWFDKWKRDYHIKPLGTKFMIVPLWEKCKFHLGRRIPIYLEPGSAFGSGYHETTRLMTRLLESFKGKIGNFLDIGCGTGILSIAASKLGAKKITGFDNDRPSSIVSEKNFRENQCEKGTFFCAQLKRSNISGLFDVVGANLLSKTLLEYRDEIVARVRPGGHLLVSGIARQNFPSFKQGFLNSKLRCLKILRGRRWVAVLYKRRR